MVPSTDAFGLVMADFDLDGDQDAYVANSGSEPDQLLLNGSGGFSVSATTYGTDASRQVAAGDFNADCATDVFVAVDGNEVVRFGDLVASML